MKWWEKSENMAIWRRTSFKWPCLWIFELCLHLWGMLTRNYRHLSIFYWRGSRFATSDFGFQISRSIFQVSLSSAYQPMHPFFSQAGSRNISIIPIISIHLFWQLPLTLQHNDEIEWRSTIDSRDAELWFHEGLISYDGLSKKSTFSLAQTDCTVQYIQYSTVNS